MGFSFYRYQRSYGLKLPFVGRQIPAGFPSPAQDYFDGTLDLAEALIKHPENTFIAKVKGRSMVEAGVEDGDLLVIDKALDYRPGALAVCFLNGEFTLKHVKREGRRLFLVPANPDFKPIKVTDDDDFRILGFVTYVIKSVYFND